MTSPSTSTLTAPATLAVIGELDLLTVGLLTAQLERAIDGFDGAVTLNMAGVTLPGLDACALVRAHTVLVAAGSSLVPAEPRRATTRLLELTGLLDTFRWRPGRADMLPASVTRRDSAEHLSPHQLA